VLTQFLVSRWLKKQPAYRREPGIFDRTPTGNGKPVSHAPLRGGIYRKKLTTGTARRIFCSGTASAFGNVTAESDGERIQNLRKA
jgi:hypothetical protein